MKTGFLLLLTFFYHGFLQAQEDTLTRKEDTIIRKNDSLISQPAAVIRDTVKPVKKPVAADTIKRQADTLTRIDSEIIPPLPDTAIHEETMIIRTPDERKTGNPRSFSGKEDLFYYLIFLLIIIGLFRRSFQKYFADLLRVFFKTTLKQRQVREQMLHAQLPSVFMNLFFLLSGGLYISFLFSYFQFSLSDNFWMQYAYCAAALGIIYLVKYFGLKLTGWLLHVEEATESYIFIVFVINKMLGISLLPFLLLLAFAGEPIQSISFTISFFLVGLLFLYRIILSYSSVRNEIKLNSFHFLLYVLAFEVLPLLLIYKALMIIL